MNDSLLDKGQIVVVNDDPAKMDELAKRLKTRGLTCAWANPGGLAAIRIGFDDAARKENDLVFTFEPLDTTKDRPGSRPIAAVVVASAADDAWLNRVLPAPQRKFGRGDYARLPGGTIVRVLGPCGRGCDPARQIHVSLLLDGTLPQPGEQHRPHERLVSPGSLSPWTPRPGEFVMAMVDCPWCINCKAGDLLRIGPDASHAETADGMSWGIVPNDNPGYLRPTSEAGFPRPRVTLAWLEREGACVAGREWFVDAFGKNAEVARDSVAAALAGKPDWLAWLEAHA